MRYIPTNDFHSSHKMDNAAASEARLVALLGEGDEGCEKSDRTWDGILVLEDGTNFKVSAWDWKGGMRCGYGVSIWCESEAVLPKWKDFLETHPLT